MRRIQEDTYQELLRFIADAGIATPIGWSPIRIFNLFTALANAQTDVGHTDTPDNSTADTVDNVDDSTIDSA